MKKHYIRPDAEYINFITKEVITNDSGFDDDEVIITPGTSDAEDGWV